MGMNADWRADNISVTFPIPAQVALNCHKSAERAAWLNGLPDVVGELERRWQVSLGAPFDGEEVSCAWVAPGRRGDGSPAVLKVGMPHMEGRDEIPGLRFWDGDPTVRLIEADDDLGAMLMERCEPGSVLREEPEPRQDEVIAGLLRRLWRRPNPGYRFRPLSEMLESWTAETLSDSERWADAGLVREGLALFGELSRGSEEVLLATDLHAGNVLRAEREPWLVIDPKPFTGDPAYDATQHLFNCRARLQADAAGTVQRFSDLLELDAVRVRLWTFARAAAQPRENWINDGLTALARSLAP